MKLTNTLSEAIISIDDKKFVTLVQKADMSLDNVFKYMQKI